MIAQNADDFYTWNTLASLAVASGAALIVGSVVGSLLGAWTKKWAALLAALAISLGLLIFEGPTEINGADYVIAVINGLLVFATAVGINQMSGGGRTEQDEPSMPSPKKRDKTAGGRGDVQAREGRSARAFTTDWLRS